MRKYIFILIILFISCKTIESVDQHDDNAVLKLLLKNNDADCDELPDTVCVWENGRITELNLYNVRIDGEIPENIGNLGQLVVLGLSSNSLYGNIPESIGNLSKLAQLSLSNNNLTGSIPESIGNLKSLFNLNLENNQLSGSIPDTIANLPVLSMLLLNDNQFNLSITDGICNIYSSLDTLNITGNQFCPPFPKCIDYPVIIGQQECPGLDCRDGYGDGYTEIDGHCYSQTDLDVLGAIITYSNPDSLNLIINFDGNDINDTLRLGQQEWHAGKLETLDCYWDTLKCNLSSGIPDNIGNLASLKTLDLQKNNLSGEIPEGFGYLSALEYLYLQDNKLTGDIPETIGDMLELTILNISDNQFSGFIPDNICNINVILLENNQFCPCFPDCINASTVQDTCSVCAVGYSSICYELNENYQGKNNISDEPICFKQSNIDILQSFIDSSTSTIDINIMDLDSSEVIDWFELGMQNWRNGDLESLKVDNIQLSGSIPNSIVHLSNLMTLHLHGNQLSGYIPEEICDLTNLDWAPDSTNENDSYIFMNQLCPPYPDCIKEFVGVQNIANCPPDSTGSE